MTEPSFADLIRRVRAGDEAAVAQLLRDYGGLVQRAAHYRLPGKRAGAAGDTEDVCQSVFLSLCLRMAAGQYELERPEQLEALLRAMARNKATSQGRRQRAERRDQRRLVGDPHADAIAAPDPSPSQQVAARELLQEMHRLLSPAEHELVELRNRGLSWEEIAGRLGETPAVLRKRLSRALDRVSRRLGLAEAGDAEAAE